MGAAGSQAPPLPCVLQASAATGSAGCAAREALLLVLLLSAEHGGAYVKAPSCTGALAGRHAQADLNALLSMGGKPQEQHSRQQPDMLQPHGPGGAFVQQALRCCRALASQSL